MRPIAQANRAPLRRYFCRRLVGDGPADYLGERRSARAEERGPIAAHLVPVCRVNRYALRRLRLRLLVNSTVIVALIGAVATVATAIVGYIVNYRAGVRLHEANRELADETHRHERELAEKGQAHERQLRQGERAYEDRKATYRQVSKWALVTAQQVQATEPILRTGRDP